ncbi:MAG: Pathogenesis-related transcriptional factor and ERF protein [Bacteroidetes bacterium]|nr:MAG: Pathogenesis-related transcriptional factor and ERF protein [Bacteroidota bacterium]
MSVKVKLKNREDKYAVLDDKVYEDLQADKYLSSIKFLDNVRAHSNGYGVFQRCITTKKGPVYETIYLHKHIAEKFIKKPKSDKKLFVRFKDGDVLNCQLENLEWVTMNTLRREMTNFKSKTGYRGVTKEKSRYRAVIYHDRKAYNLGFFDTAEEAAKAYNKKSIELFGKTGSLNKV